MTQRQCAAYFRGVLCLLLNGTGVAMAKRI